MINNLNTFWLEHLSPLIIFKIIREVGLNFLLWNVKYILKFYTVESQWGSKQCCMDKLCSKYPLLSSTKGKKSSLDYDMRVWKLKTFYNSQF